MPKSLWRSGLEASKRVCVALLSLSVFVLTTANTPRSACTGTSSMRPLRFPFAPSQLSPTALDHPLPPPPPPPYAPLQMDADNNQLPAPTRWQHDGSLPVSQAIPQHALYHAIYTLRSCCLSVQVLQAWVGEIKSRAPPTCAKIRRSLAKSTVMPDLLYELWRHKTRNTSVQQYIPTVM